MDNPNILKICPDCKKLIDKKAKVCPYCRKKFGLTKPAKYFLLFLAGLFLIPIFVRYRVEEESRINKSNPTDDKIIITGVIGVLDSGAPIVFVAATKEAFEALNKTLRAKDEYGMGLLLASELIFTPQSGTRALVIDMTMTTRKVRILEGKYRGRSGWIPYEFIIKENK